MYYLEIKNLGKKMYITNTFFGPYQGSIVLTKSKAASKLFTKEKYAKTRASTLLYRIRTFFSDRKKLEKYFGVENLKLKIEIKKLKE